MQFPYLTSYFPPAPSLDIRLTYPSGSFVGALISAFVDTGADGTLVPLGLLDEIGAPIVDETRIRSHWGEWRRVDLYTVDIEVAGLRFPAVEVVGDERSDEIILGRNFLNWLTLLLEGPSHRVDFREK